MASLLMIQLKWNWFLFRWQFHSYTLSTLSKCITCALWVWSHKLYNQTSFPPLHWKNWWKACFTRSSFSSGVCLLCLFFVFFFSLSLIPLAPLNFPLPLVKTQASGIHECGGRKTQRAEWKSTIRVDSTRQNSPTRRRVYNIRFLVVFSS